MLFVQVSFSNSSSGSLLVGVEPSSMRMKPFMNARASEGRLVQPMVQLYVLCTVEALLQAERCSFARSPARSFAASEFSQLGTYRCG